MKRVQKERKNSKMKYNITHTDNLQVFTQVQLPYQAKEAVCNVLAVRVVCSANHLIVFHGKVALVTDSYIQGGDREGIRMRMRGLTMGTNAYT